MLLEKELRKYITHYPHERRLRFKVCLPDGHGGQIRKQGFRSIEQALAWAHQEYAKLLRWSGMPQAELGKVLRFEEYSKMWLEQKGDAGVSVATIERYGDEIQHRLNPYFGHFKIADLEKHHLRSFIRESREGNLSSATLRYAVLVFKAILKDAERDSLIFPKGFRDEPLPRHRAKDPEFWDSGQVDFFLNATRGHRLNDLWTVALHTGMRAGEIAGLKWRFVHFESVRGGHCGFIEVRSVYNQKTKAIQNYTKNGDVRFIPIFPLVLEVLKKRKLRAHGEFVFGDERPLDSSHFNRQLQAALRTLPQLPRVTFHGLRHSFCSYLGSTGMNRLIVSQIMGHRSLNTTNRYSHVNENMLGEEVLRWKRQIDQQSNNKFEVVNFG